MMSLVRALLESSPLLALFLAIAAGYAIGQIRSRASHSVPARFCSAA